MLKKSFARISLVVAAVALAAGAMPAGAQLQKKPVRIVTTGFGGGTDIVSRILAAAMTPSLGQQVIVENRGSSVVPGEIVANAVADGHTLMLSTGGVMWVMPLLQKVPYDSVKDFASVSLVATFPTVLAMTASVPANSVKDLIAHAKANPGSLNYVMTATGGSAQLAAELFNLMAGVKIVAVPYKNAGTAITDLISGRVQLFFSAGGAVMPHAKTGKLKALGVTSLRQSALFPDLQPISATLPGYEMDGVYCLFAPARTPAATIKQIHAEVVKAVNQPDVKEKLLAAGVEPRGSTPAELDKLRREDAVRMAKLVKDANIR